MSEKMIRTLLIHTDGACVPNPGKGAWAFVCGNIEKSGKEVGQTTNNRMEMMAVLQAIKWAHSTNYNANMMIRTDSMIVVNGFKKLASGKWPKANKDLWKLIQMVNYGVKIERYETDTSEIHYK